MATDDPTFTSKTIGLTIKHLDKDVHWHFGVAWREKTNNVEHDTENQP